MSHPNSLTVFSPAAITTIFGGLIGAVLGVVLVVLVVLVPNASSAAHDHDYAVIPVGYAIVYMGVGAFLGSVAGLGVWGLALLAYRVAFGSRFRYIAGFVAGGLVLLPICVWAFPSVWAVNSAVALLILVFVPLMLVCFGLLALGQSGRKGR